ncbi:MAG: hypothetical protein D6710_02680 [Nitrospirae bacterium]|nr:MAG: hypothetical protein D6710_02680 [Nitrospirota bacterium]
MNELILNLKEDWDIVGPVLYLLVPATFYILALVGGKKGRFFFILGLLCHLAGMFLRAKTIGHLPLTDKHDNISFMALVMAICYPFLKRKIEDEGLSVLMLCLVCFFLFVSVTERPLNTISPFMRSPWFFIYIFFYFTAYALYGLSACVGGYYFISRNDYHEAVQYKLAMAGWVSFTLGIVAGSIWFFVAYGMYWLWTSKELWVTVTWFYYAIYIHARYIKGLKGRPASVLGVLGFAVALFTYFGIGPGKIIQSPPTQF